MIYECCGSCAPISPATSASNPENITEQSEKFSGTHSRTTMPRTADGMGVESFQFTAFSYGLPAERDEAPRACTTRNGWSPSNEIKRWPTVPVAPKMPTLKCRPSNMFSGVVRVGSKQWTCANGSHYMLTLVCLILTKSECISSGQKQMPMYSTEIKPTI